MLVAAVQLELFRMLDDICEAGDVENDLFDDLCSDAIQNGRRAGFVHITGELLLSPGSGYKRLLQIRKDQVRFARAKGRGRGMGFDEYQREGVLFFGLTVVITTHALYGMRRCPLFSQLRNTESLL